MKSGHFVICAVALAIAAANMFSPSLSGFVVSVVAMFVVLFIPTRESGS